MEIRVGEQTLIAQKLLKRMITFRFLTYEAFAVARPVGDVPFTGIVVDEQDYRIEARLMDHGVPCAAYCTREKPRSNVNTDVLAQLGLVPGPWLKTIKDLATDPDTEVQAGGVSYRVRQLRQRLAVILVKRELRLPTDGGLSPYGRGLRRVLWQCDR
jgi:ribonuclease Z